MLNYLRRLYVLEGRLSDNGLANAVAFTWITQDQADELRTEKEERDNPQPEEDPTDED